MADHGGGGKKEEKLGEAIGDWIHKKITFGSVDILGFNPFDLGNFLDYMGNWGVSRGLILWILYIGLFWVLSLQIVHLPIFTLEWVIGLAPLYLPFLLYHAALNAWVWYIQSYYLAGRDGILLEMKMPHNTERSPRGMELALIPFNLSSGETTFLNRGWQGGVRPFWSFEMASFGGSVHFYIWTWRTFRPLVESSIYSYYPDVELVEAEDYAAKFRFDPSIHDCYCTEWTKETFRRKHINGKTGGDDMNWTRDINPYPILTYHDFELEEDPDEEFKVDPLAQPLEFMSSLRPGDQMWAQIVIRLAGRPSDSVFFGKKSDGSRHLQIAEHEINEVRKEGIIEVSEDEEKTQRINRGARGAPSTAAAELVERMERNMDKYLYEVGIRGWIVSTNEVSSHYYNGMRFMWRPMGDPNHSVHLRPRRWHPPFDYPWQDYKNIRFNLAAKRFLDAYRRRLFFHSPWRTYPEPMILSGEELATLWHPVSHLVAAPGLERLHAKKAEPPHDLPTGAAHH